MLSTTMIKLILLNFERHKNELAPMSIDVDVDLSVLG